MIQRTVRSGGIVLYDYLACRGGAERVTLELVRGLPNTALGFAYRDADAFPDHVLSSITYYDLGLRSTGAGLRTVAGMRAYRLKTAFIRHYDWAIFSGHIATEAIYNRAHGLNVYYCHTLPRFAYDLHDAYRAGARPWQRPILRVLTGIVRYRYPRALARMGVLIANSQTVRARLQRYLGRDAEVVHPPCALDHYNWMGQGDYYLSTARLEPYKRVDLVVRAFRRMPDRRLIIASGGSDYARLIGLAAGASNIRFTGWIGESRLRELIGRAIATVYIPVDEDFGLSPVESMAAGKPVIGVAEGGLLETVVPSETGILIPPEPSVDAVVEAVHTLTPKVAAELREACEQRARQFSRERFLSRMSAFVGGL